MLARPDKVENLEYSHNLLRVTLSNPFEYTLLNCQVASEQYRMSSKCSWSSETRL